MEISHCAIAPLILTTLGWVFGLLFALLLQLPKPSAVSVGIETSNQNGALAMTILALSVPQNDIYNKVVVIPAMYMILSWIVNIVFVLVFLKIGWVDTENDESNNLCKLIRNYKNTMKEQKTDDSNSINKEEQSRTDIADTEMNDAL